VVAKLRLESVSSRPLQRRTRRVSRMVAHSEVGIRCNQGHASTAVLRDVSTFGCALDSEAGWLRTGMFLTITPADGWTIQAILRWVCNGRAGAEFLRPISQADARELSGGE